VRTTRPGLKNKEPHSKYGGWKFPGKEKKEKKVTGDHQARAKTGVRSGTTKGTCTTVKKPTKVQMLNSLKRETAIDERYEVLKTNKNKNKETQKKKLGGGSFLYWIKG